MSSTKPRPSKLATLFIPFLVEKKQNDAFVNWKAYQNEFLTAHNALEDSYAFAQAVRRLQKKNAFNATAHFVPHGNQSLTPRQEMHLALIARSYSMCGAELNAMQMRKAASIVFKKSVGDKWYRNFMKRHSMLIKQTKARPMPKSRTNAALRETTNHFVDSVEAMAKWGHFSERTVANTDATILFAKDEKVRFLRVVAIEKKGGSTDYGSKLGSMQPWVLADGTVVLVAFCWKVAKKAKTAPVFFPAASASGGLRSSKVGFEQLHFVSETGAFTKEMFVRMADEFMKTLMNIRGQKYLETFIFLDNCSYQKDVEMMRRAQQNGFFFIYLPPNSTHVLQPLDVVPFAVFKPLLSFAADEQKFLTKLRNSNMTLKHAMGTATLTAMDQSFKPNVIIAGFKQSGVFPWDSAVVKARAESAIVDEEAHAVRVRDKLTAEEQQLAKLAEAAVKPIIKPTKTASLRVNIDKYKKGATTTQLLSEASAPAAAAPKAKARAQPRSVQKKSKKQKRDAAKPIESDSEDNWAEISVSDEESDGGIAAAARAAQPPAPPPRAKKRAKVMHKRAANRAIVASQPPHVPNPPISAPVVLSSGPPDALQGRSETAVWVCLTEGSGQMAGKRKRKPKVVLSL